MEDMWAYAQLPQELNDPQLAAAYILTKDVSTLS